MFKAVANPTFPAEITIVGQGTEQVLSVTFRHKTRKEYLEYLERMKAGQLSMDAAISEIVESWNADVALDTSGIETLLESQPGIDAAIIQAYGDALVVARKGN